MDEKHLMSNHASNNDFGTIIHQNIYHSTSSLGVLRYPYCFKKTTNFQVSSISHHASLPLTKGPKNQPRKNSQKLRSENMFFAKTPCSRWVVHGTYSAPRPWPGWWTQVVRKSATVGDLPPEVENSWGSTLKVRWWNQPFGIGTGISGGPDLFEKVKSRYKHFRGDNWKKMVKNKWLQTFIKIFTSVCKYVLILINT